MVVPAARLISDSRIGKIQRSIRSCLSPIIWPVVRNPFGQAAGVPMSGKFNPEGKDVDHIAMLDTDEHDFRKSDLDPACGGAGSV